MKAVDFSIAVACDIGDDRLTVRLFFQAMDGHDRKICFDRPGIGKGLEDAEIPVVDIRQRNFNALELTGDILKFFKPLETSRRFSRKDFRPATSPKRYIAMLKNIAYLVAIVNRVVQTFLHVF